MSKRKLLLADDSITIQKVVNLTFADEGIEVIAVGDGNSAIDKLREDNPDLVLADVNMPGLNGYEICEKIKGSNKNTPVILLVGSFEPFDEDEAKRVGADDFLTKPFQSISQLVSKVTDLLESGGRKTDSSDSSAEASSSGKGNFTDFEDSAIDDELIQTDQIGSVPVDEKSKFEIHNENDDRLTSFAKTSEPAEPTEESYRYEDEREEEKSRNAFDRTFSEDQDLVDTKEINIDESPAEKATKQTEKEKTADSENHLPVPETASVLDLDELNLLELPPLDVPGDDFSADSAADYAENDPDEKFKQSDETFEEIDLGESSAETNHASEISSAEPETGEQTSDDEIVSPFMSVKTFDETVETSERSGTSGETASPEKVSNEREKFSAEGSLEEEEDLIDLGDDFTEVARENSAQKRSRENSAHSRPNFNRTEASGKTEFSSELIEAIADRVVEKLSERVVREIAWEVVPQMADLIIKKMAEEKMKE